jgi:hypothetical protein
MATTADQTVNYQSPLSGIIDKIIGQSNTTSGTTSGNTTGTTAGTTTSTSSADLGALNQIFNSASAGMSSEQLSALISSIFTEGANQVPSLIGAYANATGSRATGNSPTKLALDELNKNMSTQAVQALLNYNQGSQQTAANAAAQIAGNTRSQTQQNVQQQAGTSQQQQQQQQATTVNPKSSGMLAALMGGAGLANKMGLLPSFGKSAAPVTPASASSPGTISGGGSLVGNTGSATAPMLTNGGGTSGMLSTPTASSGFLAAPVAANPYGVSSGIGGGVSAGGAAPSYDFGGGISGLGGFSGSGGLLGSAADLGFGSLPSNFNAFGTLGTDSLGSNFNFGSNPFGYTGSAGGITGAVGGAGGGGIGDFFNGAASGIGSALSSAGDWLGSFFADGGQVGNRGIGAPGDTRYGAPAVAPRVPVSGNIFDMTRLRNETNAGLVAPPMQMQQGTNVQVPPGTPTGVPVDIAGMMQLLPFLIRQGTGFADGGQVSPQDGARELRTMMSQRQNSLATRPAYGFEGMNVGQIMDATARDRGIQSGIQNTLSPDLFTQLLMMLGVSNSTTGLGYADGGQVETGGATRVRNQNYLGPQQARERSGAMNYEGYAPAPAVGASVPAGGSPSMAAGAGIQALGVAPMQATAGTTAQSAGDANAQAWAQFYDSLAREAIMNQRGGGSGGVGEGGAPGQNEADNGQAGIGPSGIAAAPPGTGQAVSMGLGQIGLGAPGLSSVLAFMAFMANQVNAANQAAGSANGGVSGSSVGEGPTTATVSVGAVGDTPGTSSTVGIGDTAGGGSSDGGGTGSGNGTGNGGGPGDSAGPGYADGGIVFGAGTGTSDSIRVKPKQAGGKTLNYSDGEYVVPKDVVDALGAKTLDDICAAFHTPVNR